MDTAGLEPDPPECKSSAFPIMLPALLIKLARHDGLEPPFLYYVERLTNGLMALPVKKKCKTF